MAGDKEMKARLRAMALEFPSLTKDACREWANAGPLAVAKAAAPVKTGKLRDSGRVTVSIRKKGAEPNIVTSIRFGGPDIPYVWRVHETHKTNARFAANAINGAVPTAGSEIAARVAVKVRAAGQW